VVGNPARIVKQVSDEMLDWKTRGTRLYQSLPADCQAHLAVCEPLPEIPAVRPSQEKLFETWNRIKNSTNQ